MRLTMGLTLHAQSPVTWVVDFVRLWLAHGLRQLAARISPKTEEELFLRHLFGTLPSDQRQRDYCIGGKKVTV